MLLLTERLGFEPRRALRPYRFSRPADSTTLASLRKNGTVLSEFWDSPDSTTSLRSVGKSGTVPFHPSSGTVPIFHFFIFLSNFMSEMSMVLSTALHIS